MKAGRKARDQDRFRQAFKELGKRIAAQRKEHSWTQAQLAVRCGLSPTAISNLERVETFISLESLLLIAAALDVTVAKLLDGIDGFVRGPSVFFTEENGEEL